MATDYRLRQALPVLRDKAAVFVVGRYHLDTPPNGGYG